jgi:hypothetical protein
VREVAEKLARLELVGCVVCETGDPQASIQLLAGLRERNCNDNQT